MGQTRTCGYTGGGIRCLGGASIPCIFKSMVSDYVQSLINLQLKLHYVNSLIKLKFQTPRRKLKNAIKVFIRAQKLYNSIEPCIAFTMISWHIMFKLAHYVVQTLYFYSTVICVVTNYVWNVRSASFWERIFMMVWEYCYQRYSVCGKWY
jgi:hypothetical protein